MLICQAGRFQEEGSGEQFPLLLHYLNIFINNLCSKHVLSVEEGFTVTGISAETWMPPRSWRWERPGKSYLGTVGNKNKGSNSLIHFNIFDKKKEDQGGQNTVSGRERYMKIG